MLRQEDTLENDNDVGDKGEWTKGRHERDNILSRSLGGV